MCDIERTMRNYPYIFVRTDLYLSLVVEVDQTYFNILWIEIVKFRAVR